MVILRQWIVDNMYMPVNFEQRETVYDMSDKETVTIILEQLSYIRGRVDDIASVTSNVSARVDNHLENHKSHSTGLVNIITILIATIAIMVSIASLYYQSRESNADKKKDSTLLDIGKYIETS